MALDTTDQKLLQGLDASARSPASQLSKTIHLSKEGTNYRIKRLYERDIIDAAYAFVNVGALGQNIYRIHLILSNTEERQEAAITQFFVKSGQCIFIDHSEGRYDFIITIAVENVVHLQELLGRLKNEFGIHIGEMNLHQVVRIHRFPFGKEVVSPQSISMDAPNIKTDATDHQILSQLNLDAQRSLVDLAKVMRSTPSAVKYRLKRLEEQGVLLGTGVAIRASKLSLLPFTLNVSLRHPSDGPRIQEFFCKHTRLVYSYEMVGTYDMSFELLVEGISYYRELIRQFKTKFVDKYSHYTISIPLRRHFLGFYHPIESFEGKKEKNAKTDSAHQS